MKSNSSIFLVVLLTALASHTVLAQQPSVSQRFQQLARQYRPLSGAMRKAQTDEQRKQAVEDMLPFPARFVQLAKVSKDEKITLAIVRQAVQSLGNIDSATQIAWESNTGNYPTGCRDDSAKEIVKLLGDRYLKSRQLEPIVDRMRYGYRTEWADFLETVLKENPHRQVRGNACLALARSLNDRLRMLEVVADRPELRQCYELALGPQYLKYWQKTGPTKLRQRVSALLDRAVGEFADVPFRLGTVGEEAKSDLYAIRNLAVGKPAPETAGKDERGQPLRLSDFRGKVVLLYFWSEF